MGISLAATALQSFATNLIISKKNKNLKLIKRIGVGQFKRQKYLNQCIVFRTMHLSLHFVLQFLSFILSVSPE
jgi:hypothetical protein